MDSTATSTSVKALDLQYIFNGVEHLAAIILVLIIAKALLDKTNWFSKGLKTVVWILVALWSAAVIIQYAATTYNYYHAIRPFYTSARHSVTGL
jgi:riboflavin transporter FmnP